MDALDYKPVCGCGKPLKIFQLSGRVQIMCRECRMRRTPLPDTCVQCGAAFGRTANHQRFCSTACTQAFHRPKIAPKPKHQCDCNGCGKTFTPKKQAESSYCSRACAYAHIKVWRRGIEASPDKPGLHCLVHFNVCKQCGKEWTAKRGKSLCSRACGLKFEVVRLLERNKRAKGTKLYTCKQCGELFSPEYRNKRRTYCSPKCARKCSVRKNRQTYGNNYRSRARKAGVAYEPINRIKVFERDGWRCQVCGKATPRERQGYRYSNSPELDHVVPFALKGPHLYSNVQCACNVCNHLKGGHTVVGQRSLFNQ